ncbi:MAG: (2Fe-2S)-binding protein [Gammaproteobacteria bacterium]|nr:(2Fe-2S)-binding protein [Gammaproteobacteria bacterium]
MTEARLCRLEDLDDPDSRGFEVRIAGETESILVVRRGGSVHGYINRCPHAGSPLDWMPDQFLSLDKRHIQCATHDALFTLDAGECVAGPCVGDRLTPVALELVDGWVCLGRQAQS